MHTVDIRVASAVSRRRRRSTDAEQNNSAETEQRTRSNPWVYEDFIHGRILLLRLTRRGRMRALMTQAARRALGPYRLPFTPGTGESRSRSCVHLGAQRRHRHPNPLRKNKEHIPHRKPVILNPDFSTPPFAHNRVPPELHRREQRPSRRRQISPQEENASHRRREARSGPRFLSGGRSYPYSSLESAVVGSPIFRRHRRRSDSHRASSRYNPESATS